MWPMKRMSFYQKALVGPPPKNTLSILHYHCINDSEYL